MHPLLTRYYEDELRFLREMGGEFAEEFPNIAERLALDRGDATDPYVERLLEGVAFLTARIQLKMDAQFPRFTGHLLQTIYPHYLAPTPSMAVAQFVPSATEGALAQGMVIPRADTVLRGTLGRGPGTACEFRTGHDVTLWPLQVAAADYLSGAGAVAALRPPEGRGGRAALRLRLKATADLTFDKLALERLTLFVAGPGGVPVALCEQLLGNLLSVVVRPPGETAPWQVTLEADCLRHRGLAPDDALLPVSPRSFDGYRVLHEHFAFPARNQFVELAGLAPAVRRCAGDELELLFLFDRASPRLENAVDADTLLLFCTPVINLFPRRADRIHLNTRDTEHLIIPDRTRPLDFEVHSVLSVSGYGTGSEPVRVFTPFHALRDRELPGAGGAYFALARRPRARPARQRRGDARTGYVGSDVLLSLVDANNAPIGHDLRQIGVTALCTNSDLPLTMPLTRTGSDFSMDQGAPVTAIRCVVAPTRPRPPLAEGAVAWRLISHLSLNHLTVSDGAPGGGPEQGAAALRELLSLYADLGDGVTRKRIEGVRHVTTAPVVRRVPGRGPMPCARGLEVAVTLDETAFDGTGIFLLGAVLDAFFAKLASVNSFTETAILSQQRGEVMRWPARIGRRAIL